MERMTLSGALLSVSVFVTLAVFGLALGWIQQPLPDRPRGADVVVLPLAETPAVEDLVVAPGGDQGFGAANAGPPRVAGAPSVLADGAEGFVGAAAGIPLTPDGVRSSVSAGPPRSTPGSGDAAETAQGTTGDGEPEGVLSITLPQGGSSSIASRSAESEVAIADLPGGTGAADVNPVVVPGTGPIIALPPAPIDTITEAGPFGPLPKVGSRGQRARTLYARPFSNPERRPVVALVIGGLGLKQENTRRAIERLPGQVTLSFVPYQADLPGWLAAARAAGHETLVELPMEPFDYPNSDPGPRGLLTSLNWSENRERLMWLLSRFPGYVGVTNYLGGRFAVSEAQVSPLMEELAGRGLLFVEYPAGRRSKFQAFAETAQLPYARMRQVIDPQGAATPATTIERRLNALIDLAKEEGVAVGVGLAASNTIDTVARWVQTLEQEGVILAPVTAAAR